MKTFVKTIICSFCVLTVLCGLCGCVGILSLVHDDESGIPDEAMQIATSLLQAIENDDTEAFRELFSDTVLARSDYENGEEYTFAVYTGSLQSITQRALGTGEHIGGGPRVKNAFLIFDVVTDENEYEMYLDYYTKHETDQGKIRSFKILNTEDITESSGYFSDMTSGGWIYYPDHPYQFDH